MLLKETLDPTNQLINRHKEAKDKKNELPEFMNNNAPYNGEIIQSITAMLHEHYQNNRAMLVVRLDLLIPLNYYEQLKNQAINYFQDELSSFLELKGELCNFKSLWVKKQTQSHKVNYYEMFVLMNYNSIPSFLPYVEVANDIWKVAIGLTKKYRDQVVYLEANFGGGILLKRGNAKLCKDVFLLACQLASEVDLHPSKSWGTNRERDLPKKEV